MLIDSHVHFYPCFEYEQFFEAAHANFSTAAHALSLPLDTPGMLLLSETARDHFFCEMSRCSGRRAVGKWGVEPTMEESSLLVHRKGVDRPMLLVAGRQVSTGEGLEMLALGCNAEFPDGRSLGASIRAAREQDALVVLPWGFGKWWGARGQIVEDIIKTASAGDLFLGDNGGRTHLGPRPRQFTVAASRGIAILPGSDPLPLSSHGHRAGSYGFALNVTLDANWPMKAVKAALRGPAPPMKCYGQRTKMHAFLLNQAALRLQRRSTREG